MVHCRAPFFVNFFSHLVLCLSMSYLLWWWALYNSSPDASIEITLPHPSSNFPKWTLGVFLPHTCASALTFLTHTHLASALGSCLFLTPGHFSSLPHSLPGLCCFHVLRGSVPPSLKQTSAMWPPRSSHSPSPSEWNPWGCNWWSPQAFLWFLLLLVVSQKEVPTRWGSHWKQTFCQDPLTSCVLGGRRTFASSAQSPEF